MGTEQFILETISLFFHCIVGSKKKPSRALKIAGNFLGRLSVHSESFLFYMITISNRFTKLYTKYIKQVFFPLASWNILLSFSRVTLEIRHCHLCQQRSQKFARFKAGEFYSASWWKKGKEGSRELVILEIQSSLKNTTFHNAFLSLNIQLTLVIPFQL